MKSTAHTLQRATAVMAALLVSASFAFADSRDDEIRILRQQIEELDQKLRILERKQEIKDEEAAAKAKTQPVVSAGAGGFAITSPDKAFDLRFRGLVQADARFFFHDGGAVANDQFLLRRIRPIVQGTIGKIFEFGIVPEMCGGNSFVLQDAWVGLRFDPAINLKAGKFISPVALEPGNDRLFCESSFVNTLLPNRDIGVEIYGSFSNSVLEYRAGIYNGSRNNTANFSTDLDDDKTLAARVAVMPFKKSTDGALANLAIGVGASNGEETSTLQNIVTNGQQTLVNFAKDDASTILGNGTHTRVSPAIWLYAGPFSFVSEYAWERHEYIRKTAPLNAFTVENEAWRVSGGYVLTGEDSSPRGVNPRDAFSIQDGNWGAFEIVARISGIKIDDMLFKSTATGGAGLSTAKYGTGATAYGLGLNWYMSRNIRFFLNVEHTDVDDAGSTFPDGETAVFSRLQCSY